MKCSVYIATSVDGFIAKNDGNVDWLHTAGNKNADMGEHANMGFNDYMSSIDCMIMGRKCMEMISSFNLSAEQWPYGDIKIIALSATIKKAPNNLNNKVQMYSGDINKLVSSLENEGYKHAYIDGGTTIQAFFNLQLIDELIITRVPILIGEGIPLFGQTFKDINLEQAEATAFPNDFIQVKYKVNYK